MAPNELSLERNNIDPEKYTHFDELPLTKTGCDSYPSWDPRFKHFSPFYTVDELVDKFKELLPHETWNGVHLVITGGEPLLSWQKFYMSLLDHPFMSTLREITFETNGTQQLKPEFVEYIKHWQAEPDRLITFSISPKLSCSGEPREKAIIPSIPVSYSHVGDAYLKFVVATEDDVIEALDVIEMYKKAGFNKPIYLMPVGGVESVYRLNNVRVANLALQHGLRYSDRLHLSLWGNQWGT